MEIHCTRLVRAVPMQLHSEPWPISEWRLPTAIVGTTEHSIQEIDLVLALALSSLNVNELQLTIVDQIVPGPPSLGLPLLMLIPLKHQEAAPYRTVRGKIQVATFGILRTTPR